MNEDRVPWSARARRLLGPVLVAAQFAAVLTGQVTWQLSDFSRRAPALAYDVQRGRTMMFGGWCFGAPRADTWEWDGTNWTRRAPAQSPPARSAHALAHDFPRARTVLFGGFGTAGVLADTWEWDGAIWTQRAPVQIPPARSSHALVHDLVRGRTVLFGGNGAVTVLGDTWEWDGANWLQRTPAQNPPARFGHAGTFDVLRGRTVMFGGADGATTFADTWEWDGVNWLQRTPAQSPPAQQGSALAYDLARGRTVLFGGVLPGTDTWEWDGTNWSRAPAASPPWRGFGALAYDVTRGRTVLFGGIDPTGAEVGDTWEWDGINWSNLTPVVVTQPPARDGAALAYDSRRARTVMFGGLRAPRTPPPRWLADTWEWDGASWLLQAPATAPPARVHHALAFDSQRGRAVLFGGNDAILAALADTWEWDGINWTLRAPASSPLARTWHALAFDSARGRTVLFGGTNSSQVIFADTWEWDGATWLPRSPAQSPPARFAHALAHDPARGRTLLFGGMPAGSGLALADTWEWDGTTWSLRMSPVTPRPRSQHAMAHDSARGRTVLFGGLDNTSTSSPWLRDTWEWDGTDWIQRAPALIPPFGPLAFDARRARVVLVGNVDSWATWDYGPVQPAAFTPFGAGCAGSAGTPTLAARDGMLPYPGNDVVLEIASVPANTAVLVSFGFSHSQWGALALPLPLTGLGMTGCTLLTSGDASRLLFAAGGVATLTIAIPNHQALAGLVFYNQAFVADPPANAAGFTASNAAEGRIGSK